MLTLRSKRNASQNITPASIAINNLTNNSYKCVKLCRYRTQKYSCNTKQSNHQTNATFQQNYNCKAKQKLQSTCSVIFSITSNSSSQKPRAQQPNHVCMQNYPEDQEAKLFSHRSPFPYALRYCAKHLFKSQFNHIPILINLVLGNTQASKLSLFSQERDLSLKICITVNVTINFS